MFIYVCTHILTILSFLGSYIKYKLAFKVTDQCRPKVGLSYDSNLKNYQKCKALHGPCKILCQ